MASISAGDQQGAGAVRNYQQRRQRQNEMDARITAQQNLSQQQDYEEQHRLTHQRQLQEEEYNRSIASPGGSSSRMSRQQLAQRRLERRRQERRLRTNDLQTQTTSTQPMHQPPPPPSTEKSPRSIMKKSSSYQTLSDQQFVHNHQRQPQHHSQNTYTSSNYSSDSSANYISPPLLNRKQPTFPVEAGHPSQNNPNVFTQNGVVIDRTAFRPTRNRLRLPHESPSDEWSRHGSPATTQSRVQRGQYQQRQQQQQYQQNPQIYVPDTPSQNSGSYDKQPQMRGNYNRQPNWQQLDQQRLMNQKQEANMYRGRNDQQQNTSYVSDDEDAYNDGRVNTSFNSHANTVKAQNRARSNSKESQLPRRWRHNRISASTGRGGMSQASVSTPLSAGDSSQFQYTPRSRLAVTESLGQPEANTSMSSSHSHGARSNLFQNNDRHGWRQDNAQNTQSQYQPSSSEYGWDDRDNRQSNHAHRNVVSPTKSENSQYSQDSVSVASIRQSWEGRVEHQRGRAQDTSYDRRRNTGENQYGMWEGRNTNRVHQGEQRREQRRNVNNNKWKRNSSVPPPERRRGGYSDVDGYLSDGGYRSQPDRAELDADHVSIHDARERLWDQEERLRAVLPTDSYDSYGDVRHHRPVPSVAMASPGNASTLSTGSALFKSKFVHAAALATQKRDLRVDGGRQNNFRYPNKREDESPKESSQITDSTADTTAPSSNHNSHGENARRQQAQSTATMPAIAEAPQASVADLIARINAVSRDNPAEALARIDSIIKGESAGNVKPRQQNTGVSSLFNYDAAKKQTAVKKRPSNGKVANDPPAAPHAENRFAFGGDDHEDEEHGDPSVNESFSSDDSTVSSMTNPTYQSVQLRKSSNKRTDLERTHQVVTTRTKRAEKQKMPSDKQEFRSNQGEEDGGPLTTANLQSHNDNDWAASAPQSDYFTEFGGFRNASSQAVASSKTMQTKNNSTFQEHNESGNSHHLEQIESSNYHRERNESSNSHREQKVPKRPATPDIMNAVSSAFSDVNISFGDNTGATQDLLAKAFSDLDKKVSDIDKKVQVQNQNVVTNAFSDVDISMERKTVSQRRKELEQLSKTMTGTSEDNGGNTTQNTKSPFDWDIDDPVPAKQIKKTEPTLRVKGNKKLTQKFANLVKAFER